MNDAVTEVMDNAVADVTNAVGDAVPTDVTEKIGFVERYLNELPQKALNLGIRVVLALVFFFVGVQKNINREPTSAFGGRESI